MDWFEVGMIAVVSVIGVLYTALLAGVFYTAWRR
jgi:hypothetical protein